MHSDLVITEIVPLTGMIETPHPDGQGLVALTEAGTPGFKSLNPWGSWQANATHPGGWERFFPYGGGWFAYREDTGRLFFVTRVPKIPYLP